MFNNLHTLSKPLKFPVNYTSIYCKQKKIYYAVTIKMFTISDTVLQ